MVAAGLALTLAAVRATTLYPAASVNVKPEAVLDPHRTILCDLGRDHLASGLNVLPLTARRAFDPPRRRGTDHIFVNAHVAGPGPLIAAGAWRILSHRFKVANTRILPFAHGPPARVPRLRLFPSLVHASIDPRDPQSLMLTNLAAFANLPDIQRERRPLTPLEWVATAWRAASDLRAARVVLR